MFSRSGFQIFLRSYTWCKGAAPIGIDLHPAPKTPPDGGFAVKAKTILSLTLGSRIHISDLDAALKPMSPKPLATQPKQPRGQFRHSEDILIAVIPRVILNPHLCLTLKSQKRVQQHEKNIYIYICACRCKFLQAPLSAGFYHLLLLFFLFFFFA